MMDAQENTDKIGGTSAIIEAQVETQNNRSNCNVFKKPASVQLVKQEPAIHMVKQPNPTIHVLGPALFPLQNSPQRLAPRQKKQSLGPGYSQLDWHALQKTIRQTQPPCRIPLSQLSLHGKDSKAGVWLSYHGKVYDITAYSKFHPGGIDELMKGAGRECGKEVDAIHSWVNVERVLHNFLVGFLSLDS